MLGVESKFSPGTAAAPTSTVEITISCRNLLNMDIGSKSDPMCVVYNKPRGAQHFVEWRRTETIQDNLNPDFTEKVTLEYRFEESQPLRFEVFDVDSKSADLAKHDFIGFYECTLGHIVASGPEGLTAPLINNPYRTDQGNEEPGDIILIAEELASLKDEVTLKFAANDVGTVSCCMFNPSIIYTISKLNDAGKAILVSRSDKIASNNPIWSPVTISVRSLCNGDRDRTLKLELLQVARNGNQKLIGYSNTTLNQLAGQGTHGTRLLGKDGKPTNATIVVLQCQLKPIYTFLDYIQNGTEIHACFAIDFTSSNGNPAESTSLHFFSEEIETPPNPYEQAIQSVGNIIQDYDNDKMFPVYGFGARIPPVGAVSHNFYVTLNQNSSVFAIAGVLEAYRNCISQIQLYGPTCFSPIINHVAELASQCQNGTEYYVLLIITDGVITDMASTKEAIVKASNLPLSIIIVGVGGADYTAMEELDGDSVRISYNGKAAARDIVQFVPYRDAYTWMSQTVGATVPAATSPRASFGGSDSTHKQAQVTLAQEVLYEIPDQITSYMKSRGIFPGKTHSASSRSRIIPNANA